MDLSAMTLEKPILITGVSCVGKTTVGKALAELLGIPFADLDHVVERQLGAPIARLQQRFGTMDRFREAAAGILAELLRSFGGAPVVIALPSRGLMSPYWRCLKKHPCVTVVLEDAPEHILDRITFFDDDSRPIQKELTPHERTLYLSEICRDMAYFGRSYRKADIRVSICGCSVAQAAQRIKEELGKAGGSRGQETVAPTAICRGIRPLDTVDCAAARRDTSSAL